MSKAKFFYRTGDIVQDIKGAINRPHPPLPKMGFDLISTFEQIIFFERHVTS